jgi:3-deoxy-D-manno-octulosonate 8-phosphate phosphatase (KDO 8-P phosphatase)
MPLSVDQISSFFLGRFFPEPGPIQKRLPFIRAFVFDWDGVFNNGTKDISGASPFSEVDAMGTNLLRFNHFLITQHNLITAIISGEKNPMAFAFAKREHFNGVYYKIRHKAEALTHFCKSNDLRPEEVAFVFDDVLDFSAAKLCSLRFMIGRNANPLLTDFAITNNLVDYITCHEGGDHAVREITELVMALGGQFDETIHHRMEFSASYKNYWQIRNAIEPAFYTMEDMTQIQQISQ